jgi:hypothetical protein
MNLRFQLPLSVLPLQVERARLVVQVRAPGRRFTVTGAADAAELLSVESPNDTLQVDLTQEALLRLDDQGGLTLRIKIGELAAGGPTMGGAPARWSIAALGLEVTGRTLPAE